MITKENLDALRRELSIKSNKGSLFLGLTESADKMYYIPLFMSANLIVISILLRAKC
jgi:hypothetical protein